MKLSHLIGFAAVVMFGVLLVVGSLWRHKKTSASEVKLIGEHGLVETKLDPEGTVIVAGELWRARSNNGEAIGAHARVRVVGMQGPLVLVELI